MATGKVIVLFAAFLTVCATKYEPNWDSIDSRPLPAWFDDAKFGIFLHWGVYSVPSYLSEWFWMYWQGIQRHDAVQFMEKNYPPDWTYADFASQFNAEFFDPYEWATIFNASGARYVVLTSKHHEGFTMWPSKYSFNWNAMQVGPKRDLVGELATAIRNRTGLKFGLYHSMFEWFNPLWLQDKQNNFTTNYYTHGKALPELYEIVNNYLPEVIWSDGAPAPDWYWNSTVFLAWLYNESPVKDTVVVNDRWGFNAPCHHGGYYTCQDRYNPGHLVNHKWENCFTIDKRSWGYRRNANIADYTTIEELIMELSSTVSCGGNLLLNVGPTHDGRIMPIFEERLRQMGAWLSVNGEAIYSSIPWKYAQNDSLTKGVWYTSKKSNESSTGYVVYAIVLSWPEDNVLSLGSAVSTPQTSVSMLGLSSHKLRFIDSDGMKVLFPTLSYRQLPCKWAWVLRLVNLAF